MWRLVLFCVIVSFTSCNDDKTSNQVTQDTHEGYEKIWLLRDSVYYFSGGDKVAGIRIPATSTDKLHLIAQADAPIYLFKNETLIDESVHNSLYFSQSLQANDTLTLFVHQNVKEIHYGVYSFEPIADKGDFIELISHHRTATETHSNMLLMLTLIAMIGLALIKTKFAKRFHQVMSFREMFTARLNEGDQSRIRLLDRDNIVLSVFYSFITSALISFIYSNIQSGFLDLQISGIGGFVKIWIIVILLLAAKIILVAIMSALYGKYKWTAIYVKEMLNINLLFVMILYFITFLIYLNQDGLPAYITVFLSYSLLLAYFVRLILLYFKILKLSSFSNLYLFSYFCTVEVFPFLIGLKYFV